MRIQLLALFFLSFVSLMAQKELSLTDLSAFEAHAGNWMVVNDVYMDRDFDIHELYKEDENDNKSTRKKKKKKKRKKVIEAPKPLTFEEGSGVLFNNMTLDKKDHLITNWEHGDLHLELEVMLPKGSNSGIYLQGRYEVQLFDSWGVKNPKFSDIGGIYRNWETEPDKIFRGIAPSSNPAKAPGLWQKLRIHFKAPKFDENGKKTHNARFVLVELNGVAIHENVEVPLPTGGPIEKNEVAMGPLMIQGDHGAVAFRNIKYQSLQPASVHISDLTYEAFKGGFQGLEELEAANPIATGTAELIDFRHTGEEDSYGIIYKGNLNILEKAKYTLTVPFTGGVRLSFNNKILEAVNSPDNQGLIKHELELEPGVYPFILENFKAAGWRPPIIGFNVGSNLAETKVFNAYESNPTRGNVIAPIYVDVKGSPEMLRGFVFFKNDLEGEKLSHTIAVGTPEGVHYVFDMELGHLIGGWRGDFVDATPMWHSRGDGSFRPNGSVAWTFLNQPFAQLDSMDTAFPDVKRTTDYKTKGYSIDPETKLPIFKYQYKNITVTHKIAPSADQNSLISTLNFSDLSGENYYYKLAEGSIQKLPDGSYVVNRHYYLNFLTASNPILRTIDGVTELLVPVNGNSLKFEMIW